MAAGPVAAKLAHCSSRSDGSDGPVIRLVPTAYESVRWLDSGWLVCAASRCIVLLRLCRILGSGRALPAGARASSGVFVELLTFFVLTYSCWDAARRNPCVCRNLRLLAAYFLTSSRLLR